MSTMVQIPVRVKPPPADTGETISPGCASFEIATPLKGARMIVLSRWSAELDLSFGDVHLLAQRADARVDRVDIPPWQRSRSACVTTPSLRSVVMRAERQLRLGEADLVLAHRPMRAACLRFGQRQRRPRRRVVKPGKHLAPAAPPAFFDVDLDDFAGDLRRDGRAPARGDVAGGVQNGRLRAGCPLGHGDRLDVDGPLARGPRPGAAPGRLRAATGPPPT